METNHKRSRGFIEDKLVAKPGSSDVQYSTKASSQSSSSASVGDYESIGHVENLYSYDQSIDDRAASYILSVQEGFRLERVV
ncbi:hypothetical protein Patl1_01238 [Pistacia atlantica]|uniref:Uncharacterized protein n=1 Tax=Pistacia atlantica TaxID=434234 RepID=A0ACC1C5U9_9ROSI|nr:hypothetical protein Patl1_01238 [Pistacia atlantica]